MFAHQICKDQINQIKFGSPIISTNYKSASMNRTKPLKPINNKTVVFVCNGFDIKSFNSLLENNFPLLHKKGIRGIALSEPINDSKLALSQLLSGFKPEYSGYLIKKNNSVNGIPLDDLLKVASDNKRKTIYFEENNPDSNSKENFKLVLNSWAQYDLLFFDFSNQTGFKDLSEDYLQPILKKCTDNDQFMICSLVPENASNSFSSMTKLYLSPFYFFGKSVLTFEKPITIKIEDLTATLAYSTGLSLPSDCLGYPVHSFFSIPLEEKISRSTYSIENYIMNSVRLLYSFHMNESIIAGYLIESNDRILLTKATTIEEVDTRFSSIFQEFNSYVTETRQRNNLLLSLLFLVLSVLLFFTWLILLLKYYRSFLFGFLMIGIYFIFQYFVFRIPMSLPQIELMSIRWFFFHFGIPFLLAGIFVSILLTIMGGYLFDIKLDEILKDMNGIIATFGLFLLCEITFIINFQGFKINFTSPGYFAQTVLLRDFSLIIISILCLGIMYCTSFLTYKLLLKYGPKQGL